MGRLWKTSKERWKTKHYISRLTRWHKMCHLVRRETEKEPGQGEDMPSNGAAGSNASSNNQADWAFEVALQFDKLLREEAADQSAVSGFSACLRSGAGAPSPTDSTFLHSDRTISAFSRAWRRAYDSPVATVEDLAQRIEEKVDEAQRLLMSPKPRDISSARAACEDMKRFFLSVHRELVMQQFPPRRIRRTTVTDDLVHG